MITWDEYYDAEMKRIDQSKRRLERAAAVILLILLCVNIVFLYFGVTL